MKNLECSSRGDKRFSAMYARVQYEGVMDTIENHYQKVKRDAYGHIPGKGKKVDHIIVYDAKLPPEYLTQFYKFLWFSYFKKNMELIEVIHEYDTFSDMFRGHSINCQADIITDVRYNGLKSLVPACKELKEAIRNNLKEEK